MPFIIFDTEYTSWRGCQEHGWHGQQKREVVQLAALKVSDDLDRVSELNIYCRPTINPVLSDYFVNLSGIDNDFIAAHGVSFPECYHQFMNFVNHNLCLSFGWGRGWMDPGDGVIMAENLALNQMPRDTQTRYYNIAAWFQEVFQCHNIQVDTVNSGRIAKTLGDEGKLASLGLDEHNAFYDVYSILTGIRHFKSDWLDFYNTRCR